MPWKKGAVVIVKRGDKEWADAIEEALSERIKRANKEEIDEMEMELVFLRKRDNEYWNEMIEEAEAKYGENYIPPKWIQKIVSGFAFVMYYIGKFIDKYLKIKEPGQ